MALAEFEDISCAAFAMLCEGRKGFADEVVEQASKEFNLAANLVDLGNVVVQTGCETLKQSLIKGFGEDWADKYMAALKEAEDDLT